MIEVSKHGTTCTGDGVTLFRMVALQKALSLEVRTGMQMTRGRTAYAIIKSEYGLKGNKQKVLDQFTVMVEEFSAKVPRKAV